MSEKDRPGSDDVDTRPHPRPAALSHMVQTIKVDAVTIELDQADVVVEEAPTELLRRDDVLRKVKADRGEVEKDYSKPTIQVPAIGQATVPDRPTILEVDYSNADAHLRTTVEMGDQSQWVEFVAEVDKHGSLVLPIELVRLRLFKPGQRLRLKAQIIDE